MTKLRHNKYPLSLQAMEFELMNYKMELKLRETSAHPVTILETI